MIAADGSSPVRYRPDVDGLRAVAIVPVVLYHAGIAGFGGGFVGVDVFFVISGFLITSFIAAEIEAQTFSLANFYLRRIRRIFPALFVMMAFSAWIGWLWLMPEDYKLLGQSIFAATLFSSNVLFWWQSGYFDAPLAERPLLHTWSLGVEEQFYAFFPLYLLLVYKAFPRWRIPATIAVAILSFGLSVLTVKDHPDAAFYLAPGRFWELFIGALLAMGAVKPPTNRRWSQAASIAGATMIGMAVFAFSKETIFPGAAALLPTLGAASIIWSGHGAGGSITKVLSRRSPVFIGQISYSLYLWHFPLLAFGAYVATQGLGTFARMSLVLLSAALACASWRFIEQPVRRGRGIFAGRPAMFGSAAAALVLFGGFGLAAHLSDGFPGRVPTAGVAILAGATDFDPDRAACSTLAAADLSTKPICRFGNATVVPRFALWGDSHAEALRTAVDAAAVRAGEAGVFVGRGGCVPALGIVRLDEPQCGEVNNAVFRFLVDRPEIQTVILAGRWGLWAEGTRYKHEGRQPVAVALSVGAAPDNHRALATGLENTVSRLIASGKTVWLVGPIPEIGYAVPRALYMAQLEIPGGVDVRPTSLEFDARQHFVIDLFDKLAREYPVSVVWPDRALCDHGKCRVEADGRPIYWDDDHLTRFGADSISATFDPIFR